VLLTAVVVPVAAQLVALVKVEGQAQPVLCFLSVKGPILP
jgi:hypothetical protein